MQPRGLGALLSVAGKPVSPSVVGEGAGFCFLFLEVPPFTLVSPRVQPRGSCRKAAGPQGAPRPAARWPGRQKAQPRGGSRHPGGGTVSALGLPAPLPDPDWGGESGR